MTPPVVVAVLRGYGLTPHALARILNVAPITVTRWVKGQSPPTGLAAEILTAMARAVEVLPSARARIIGDELRLGLGAYLHRAIEREVARLDVIHFPPKK